MWTSLGSSLCFKRAASKSRPLTAEYDIIIYHSVHGKKITSVDMCDKTGFLTPSHNSCAVNTHHSSLNKLGDFSDNKNDTGIIADTFGEGIYGSARTIKPTRSSKQYEVWGQYGHCLSLTNWPLSQAISNFSIVDVVNHYCKMKLVLYFIWESTDYQMIPTSSSSPYHLSEGLDQSTSSSGKMTSPKNKLCLQKSLCHTPTLRVCLDSSWRLIGYYSGSDIT